MIACRSVLESGGGNLAVDSLQITSPATKTIFKKNDPIDLSGLVVTGTVGHMSGDVTQDCTVSPSIFTDLGENTVTLSYGGLSVSYEVTVTNELRLVPWATGTDLEIAAMLAAHYNDEINIYECEGWNIGAERSVSLAAMSATGVSESHVAQTVSFILMDKNVRDLVTPINGHTKCAFVVGQGNVLKNGNTMETGYMHPTYTTNNGGWGVTNRRTWCNSVYKNAIPENFRSLFKQFKYHANKGLNYSNQIEELQDYFVLPSFYEIFGKKIQEDTQLAKYAATGEASETYPKAKGGWYWTRTASDNSGYNHCFYGSDGIYSYSDQPSATCTRTDYWGFAPQGVI